MGASSVVPGLQLGGQQLIERMQFYVFPVSTVNPVGTIQENLNLKTDTDAPFRLYGIAIWTNNVAGGGAFDGQMLLRFYRPDGRLTQRLFTAANAIAPGNQYAGNPTPTGANPNQALVTPVTPNIIWPAQAVITMDVQTLVAAVKNPSAIVIFIGTKLFREGEVWAPTYPTKADGTPSFTARPYINNISVPNVTLSPGAPPVLNRPFTVEQDADFVFQLGGYSDVSAATGGLPMSLLDLGFRMKDWSEYPYMNDYVPVALLFPFLTAQMPGFTFPEIYVPANQQLWFDFKYLWS